MKVAIVYFGIPRNTAMCYPSIEQHIYAQLPADFGVKSFYHFYDQQDVINPRSGEHGVLSKENYEPFSWMDGELELPGICLTRWGSDELKARGDVWKDEYRSFSNLIHQLNSLYRVTSRVEAYGPDVVIFLRPDLLYLDPIPVFAIRAAANKSKAVYIPNWQWWNGLNDRFAICGRQAYLPYGKRIERALEYCQRSGRALHAERLLRFVMADSGALLHTLDVRAARVRIGGEIVDETFSSTRSMGRRENRYAHMIASIRSRSDKIVVEAKEWWRP